MGKIPLSELDPQAIIPLARPGAETSPGFPLHTYFQGIQQVIEKRGFKGLLGALRTCLSREVTLHEIKEILVYSEKHGSDYHPARVEVCLDDRAIPFVMNVALSERGRLVLANEFKALNELNRRQGRSYLPQAYFQDETEVPSGLEETLSLPMYLAEWLEGFYEFHLSRDPVDGNQKLVLWDSVSHNHFLSEPSADKIYREIAYILTYYYDLATYAQLHPWHLAAGDFIARLDGDRVEVRLVAARQYGPLIGPPELPWEEALLFFLLNLTVRIRVDRLDGVGETAWANEGCLRPAVAGFYQALKGKKQTADVPDHFVDCFREYLASQTLEDLADRLSALVEISGPSTQDYVILTTVLDRHLRELLPLIQK